MLRWYQNQLQKHGATEATKLLWRVSWSKLNDRLGNRFLPHRVECPVCGWTGRKFADYLDVGGFYSPNLECPRCISHSRHRALYLWLKNDFQLSAKSGTALVCAPEKALDALWDSVPALQVTRLDIEPSRGVDVLADIQKLPFADESQDIIWCHHVLEQAADDHLAISELYRVLRRTGTLIISSGMTAEPLTEEFGRANKELFGNWRVYGQDFSERLLQGGFRAEEIIYNLSPPEIDKYVIIVEKVYLCRK